MSGTAYPEASRSEPKRRRHPAPATGKHAQPRRDTARFAVERAWSHARARYPHAREFFGATLYLVARPTMAEPSRRKSTGRAASAKTPLRPCQWEHFP